MKIKQRAQAGSLESNDVYVTIEPREAALEIEVESTVLQQFGEQIYQVARATLAACGVEGCLLRLQDRGALDYTIRARIRTAVKRSL